VPFYGSVFVCMDDPNVAALRPRLKRQVRTYGTNPQVDIRALDLRMEGWRSRFRVRAFGEDLGEFTIGVPGHHMVLNALATIGVALELGVEREVIRASLASFTGADRRFQKRGERDGVLVIDDYGHHPTEIAATLAAARDGFPERRIVVAFQPHRYSRTQALLEEFGRAFFNADVVLVSDIYAASEPPIPGLTGQSVVDAILAHGQREASYVPRIDDMPQALAGLVRPGDLLVTMGAGTITGVGPAFLAL